MSAYSLTLLLRTPPVSTEMSTVALRVWILAASALMLATSSSLVASRRVALPMRGWTVCERKKQAESGRISRIGKQARNDFDGDKDLMSKLLVYRQDTIRFVVVVVNGSSTDSRRRADRE